MLAAAPIIAGVFLAWRLAAPPSRAPLPAPADDAGMPAATEPGATRPDTAPATINGLEMSRGLDQAAPGGPSASTVKEQPSPEAPVSAAAAELAPATPTVLPAEELPLEMAPPDWPELTLQMLFHGPEGGRSFVQINGRNYRVGERLEDGPEVLEIAPHGVILAYRGKNVLLAMDR